MFNDDVYLHSLTLNTSLLTPDVLSLVVPVRFSCHILCLDICVVLLTG